MAARPGQPTTMPPRGNSKALEQRMEHLMKLFAGQVEFLQKDSVKPKNAKVVLAKSEIIAQLIVDGAQEVGDFRQYVSAGDCVYRSAKKFCLLAADTMLAQKEVTRACIDDVLRSYVKSLKSKEFDQFQADIQMAFRNFLVLIYFY